MSLSLKNFIDNININSNLKLSLSLSLSLPLPFSLPLSLLKNDNSKLLFNPITGSKLFKENLPSRNLLLYKLDCERMNFDDNKLYEDIILMKETL